MMAVNLTEGENHLSVYYRFDFPSGERYIIEVEPLSPEVARDVLAATTEEYTMVTLHLPKSVPQYFLAGVRASYGFVANHLIGTPRVARFVTHMIPLITKVAPPDDIAQAADQWFATEQARAEQQGQL